GRLSAATGTVKSPSNTSPDIRTMVGPVNSSAKATEPSPVFGGTNVRRAASRWSFNIGGADWAGGMAAKFRILAVWRYVPAIKSIGPTGLPVLDLKKRLRTYPLPLLETCWSTKVSLGVVTG